MHLIFFLYFLIFGFKINLLVVISKLIFVSRQEYKKTGVKFLKGLHMYNIFTGSIFEILWQSDTF